MNATLLDMSPKKKAARNGTEQVQEQDKSGKIGATKVVRIAEDLYRKIITIMANTDFDGDVADLIDPWLRPHVEAKYKDVVRKMNSEI